MVHQALDNMGPATARCIANVFDGITRHPPESLAFKARTEAAGFNHAVQQRDSGEHIG